MYSVLSKLNSLITNPTVSTTVVRHASNKTDFHNRLNFVCNFLDTLHISKNSNNLIGHQHKRDSSSFFNKKSAHQIWNSISSVSAAGRKRGRGKLKGKKVIRDLNKGQVIGIGTANIRWPGLSAPIIRGRELVERQHLPEDKSIQEEIYKLRDSAKGRKKIKLTAIDRGWTGGHPEGRKIGPPDPIGDLNFNGFETVILEQRAVSHLTKKFGKVRNMNVFVMTGNRNGLVGLGASTAPTSAAALKRAKNRAGQHLMFIERYEDHTVLHDFFTRFANSKITVWKKPRGFGLRCHRAIKSVCELIGITDLHAKVEGGDSVQCIVQSFLLGLLRQKSYKELAEETQLHVVELSPENNYFPKVLASPTNPIESSDDVPNFGLYVFDDKVFHFKKKWPPFFTKLHRYPIVLRKLENVRSHFNTRIMLRAEHGELRSFLTDQYPECKPHLPRWTKSIKEQKAKEEGEEIAE